MFKNLNEQLFKNIFSNTNKISHIFSVLTCILISAFIPQIMFLEDFQFR
jgi:hypothetical protein